MKIRVIGGGLAGPEAEESEIERAIRSTFSQAAKVSIR